MADNGPWLGVRWASDVSRAIRLAAVSRANRGVVADFAGENGLAGAGVTVLSGRIFWYSRFRIVVFVPLASGCFMNRVSDSRDVGKSSNPSNS